MVSASCPCGGLAQHHVRSKLYTMVVSRPRQIQQLLGSFHNGDPDGRYKSSGPVLLEE